jgi:ATP-binding cassette subfamily B protein/ATP-binding cassette subfamily C protein
MTLFEKITFLKPVTDKLLRLMTRKHKIYLVIMLILTIGFSLIETIGISAIMPFISIVSDPSLLESGWYKKAFDFMGFANAEKFIITMGIGIIIFYIFRGVYSVALTYLTSRYSIGMYRHFSVKLFKLNLLVSYKVYAQKNSAELMHSIVRETHDTSKVVLNILQLCSEIFTILMVYAVIVFINWKMTLIVTAVLLFIVILLLSLLTRESSLQGKKKVTSSRKMNRILKETLGNLKYVKLKGNEEEILSDYEKSIKIYTRSEVITNVLGIIPKGILESIGFSLLIAAVVFIVWIYHDASKVIPIISMYALALYRILPSIHRMLLNINHIVYNEKTLEGVYENTHQPAEKEGNAPVAFERSIRLENINFKYLTGGDVITGISLVINKGEKVAFTGESGSGKSTLVDIITGIHRPLSGEVFIDDTLLTNDNIRSWRKKIGYIPQSIYLFDGTVAENVAFGSEPDEEKIKTALVKANIWDFLAHKEGINTLVGDGGIQLSGGQQQRIGIARALYDDPEVLVLDEATSALDTETEQKIMDEIYSVSAHKTLIVIAHRLSTVEHCDRRIRIADGRIAVTDQLCKQ